MTDPEKAFSEKPSHLTKSTRAMRDKALWAADRVNRRRIPGVRESRSRAKPGQIY
jgi:hypothetical protein